MFNYLLLKNFQKPLNVLILSILFSVIFALNISAEDYSRLTPSVNTPESTMQAITVTGVVTDEFGDPLPGVNVSIKGTTQGVSTNAGGAFSLSVPDQNATLVFSYIGFTSQETVVGAQRTINIIMVEDTRQIEEVVVIGYGAVRKSDLTGAVASVSERHFTDQPITRLDQAINGRVPGVSIITNSGSPDQSITIRIRGANSIYGGNDPLYVVDGVPNSTLFNGLNPNDIQSIEILKDASATAIYGSRGANGVVLVTTKRGTEGKARITFNTQHSWSKMAKQLELLDPYNYGKQINEFFVNSYSEAQLNAFKDGTAGTDWIDLFFRTSYSQNHQLNISGGTNKMRYAVSGSYIDTQGILILSQQQRYNLRSNISVEATDWLKVDMDISAFRRHNSKMGGRGNIWNPIADAYTSSPTMELKDANGNWQKDPFCSITDNPYGRWTMDLDDSYSNYLSNNLKLTFILPVKGLTFNLQGSANYSSGSSFSMNSYANGLRLNQSESSASNSRNDSFSWYNMNQLSYVNKWGDHSINATAVAEFTKSESGSLSAGVNTLLTEAAGYWNLGLGAMNSISNSYSGSSMASFIGRAFYSFKDRYLLTATIRQDGTSVFYTGRKWGTFPSVGLSWIASQEDFIRNMNVFDMLKVRASWGITGNQSIGSYSTLGLLSSATYNWGTTVNQTGYRVNNPPARNLTWEKTRQIDVGLDLGFLNNRLSATIDVYQKNTYDLLLRKPIPIYDGGGDELVNLGEVRNRGIDVSVTGVIFQRKDLKWESMFNISYYKNKVIDLAGEDEISMGRAGGTNQTMDIEPAVVKVGYPLGSIKGWTWLGLWSKEEAAQAAQWGQFPGDNHFQSFTGNMEGGVYRLSTEDATIIGKSSPDVTLGWNNTFSYKRLDVNVFFQGAFGHNRINLARWYLNERASDARMITGKEGWLNKWTEDNQDTKVPNPYSATVMSRVVSHQYMEKADFVRLKNLSIAYTLPKAKVKFGDLRIGMSAQNLFTFTKYTGLDPEGNMGNGGDDTQAGFDGFSYPLARTFTADLRFTF